MVLLKDIHLNYDTDKGTDHSYIDTYENIFNESRDKPISLLEVGILSGGSLKMFHEYFSQGAIYGIDNFNQMVGFNNKPINKLEVISELEKYDRIHVYDDDSTNVKIIPKNLKFDFIIDDGDHTPDGQMKTFASLFPYLHEEGTYIIEDVAGVANANIIANYLRKQKLNVEILSFLKNGRGDDILIIVNRHTKYII